MAARERQAAKLLIDAVLLNVKYYFLQFGDKSELRIISC
jgi:hypothetical protein